MFFIQRRSFNHSIIFLCFEKFTTVLSWWNQLANLHFKWLELEIQQAGKELFEQQLVKSIATMIQCMWDKMSIDGPLNTRTAERL